MADASDFVLELQQMRRWYLYEFHDEPDIVTDRLSQMISKWRSIAIKEATEPSKQKHTCCCCCCKK